MDYEGGEIGSTRGEPHSFQNSYFIKNRHRYRKYASCLVITGYTSREVGY